MVKVTCNSWARRMEPAMCRDGRGSLLINDRLLELLEKEDEGLQPFFDVLLRHAASQFKAVIQDRVPVTVQIGARELLISVPAVEPRKRDLFPREKHRQLHGLTTVEQEHLVPIHFKRIGGVVNFLEV